MEDDRDDDGDPGDDGPTAEQLAQVHVLIAKRDDITAIKDDAERLEAARRFHTELEAT